ncbi:MULTISPECIES: hypothetical protein [Oceanobacillus]|uniref:Uncharacterized protein n=1 Tax=Oceanobacillus kimchii TaxID=746691 RepID=A0ABQ5TGM5_9BACI|nr:MULTISPECIES: hypothetical protein [Oceanobacillus]MBT2598683.1 hypothetical protein [Oceanobacillus sp. ISL-74]MBT2651602.1 hypothetical protein [Oceanobacillus sp. ISL-73]MCT1576251.1 hypothetical protein [Oceanobacillus kimchii]MCT2135888.1 hypothetical protein [Oceanobacillus kimchii]OEH54687.1 hypothetical protein AQ616_13090 [Oceanobacillus sp. E9]
MGWKSIEMQVALPRVQDAGKIQDQMDKQGQHLQESLAQLQAKKQELRSKKVNELNHTYKVDSNNKRKHESKDENKDDNQEQKSEHPFLGSKIDYNG